MPLKTVARNATVIYTKNQPIEVFNAPVVLGSSSLSSLQGLSYFQAPSAMTISKVEIQIFTKGTASGILELDVLKSSSLSIAAVSIMTTKPSLDMSTAVDYQSASGVINSGLSSLNEGDYIRIDISQIPTNLTSFHIRIYGTN